MKRSNNSIVVILLVLTLIAAVLAYRTKQATQRNLHRTPNFTRQEH
jgi:hypothetical protein